jgi:hypothetical protein
VTKWTPERLDDLAAALLASPHISALSEGAFGTVASYLPGRRINGLRVLPDDRLEVHVVMVWGSTVDDVEASILRAFDDPAELAHLVIEDVSMPPTEKRAALAAGAQEAP